MIELGGAPWIFQNELSAAIGNWREGMTYFRGLKSSRTQDEPCSSHIALEIIARPCFAATGRSKRLLKCASKPLCARNHCSCLFESMQNIKPSLFLHLPLAITDRACSAAIERSKSLFGRASKPLGARNRWSRKFFLIRSHFRFVCEISSEIALLRSVHCSDRCFV